MSKLIRPVELCELLSVSRSTISRLERQPDFPASVRIGLRAKGWRLVDIEAWLKKREESHLSTEAAARA